MSKYEAGQVIQIRTDYESTSYIAPGKIYEATVIQPGDNVALVRALDERGEYFRPVIGAGSDHIGGNYWEVVQ